MRMQRVAVLGATGSIGASALDVIARHPQALRASVLAAGSRVDELVALCARHRPEHAVIADQAAGLAGRAGIGVRVWEPEALARDGFGGILAVGTGSVRSPRLVELSWAPAAAGAPVGGAADPQLRHVVLVGKGITFDSGGLSLKPGPKMDQMTSDMSGAAAVVAVTLAAARLRLPVAVTA